MTKDLKKDRIRTNDFKRQTLFFIRSYHTFSDSEPAKKLTRIACKARST